MPELFGHKSLALFDLWSVAHFLTGCGLVYVFHAIGRVRRTSVEAKLVLVLLISCTWELVEMYLELGLGGAAVAVWFDGVEHPANRILTDQMLFLAGFALTLRHRWAALPAKAASATWLFVHVVFLPHSMYLQEWWARA